MVVAVQPATTTKHEEVSEDKKVIVMALAARSGCVTLQSKYASALLSPPSLRLAAIIKAGKLF